MPQIRPIADLRNTAKISELCHARREPLFITKNGYGDLECVLKPIHATCKPHFVEDLARFRSA